MLEVLTQLAASDARAAGRIVGFLLPIAIIAFVIYYIVKKKKK